MKRRIEKGVTLLENLIAMLILGVGLLGMLGVILNSLKLTLSSNYRTIAVMHAESLAERARGQPALLTGTASFSTLPAATTTAASCRLGGTSGSVLSNVRCECFNSTGCTDTGDFLFTIIQSWRDQLTTGAAGTANANSQGSLPNGRGMICRDSTTLATLHQIDPSANTWQCDGTGGFVVKVCWNEQRVSGSAASGATASATSAEFKQASGWLCTFVPI